MLEKIVNVDFIHSTNKGLLGRIMGKKDIIRILKNYKREFANQYNILTIGIFGSVARGEAGDESDVDIVVRISEPDFFILAGIKNDLENRLNKSVDIVSYKDSMNPFLKMRIDSEVVYV